MDNCVSNGGPTPNILFLFTLSTTTKILIIQLGFEVPLFYLRISPGFPALWL